jgi:hypothetical protein
MKPEDKPGEPQTTPAASQDNPKNPFREEALAPDTTPEEDAAAEQQRKEALTERD